MNFDAELFSLGFLYAGALLGLVLFVVSVVYAPWRALVYKNERQHVFYCAIIAMFLMMQLQLPWADSLHLHFLCINTLVVVFGWSLAIFIGGAAEILSFCWDKQYGFANGLVVGWDFCVSVVVPASVAHLTLQRILRADSKNLFIFLFGTGFFGSILSLLVSLVSGLLLLAVAGQWELLGKLYNEGLIIALHAYGEGFINGMIITAITVYFPGLVRAFDEDKYLSK